MTDALLTNFHFIRPWWFLALLPLAWLLYRFYRNVNAKNQWQEEVDPELLSHLLDGQASSVARGVFVAVGALWCLAVFALAGPSWEKLVTPVYRGLQERVLVVDLSRSMNAADVKPSRIDRLRQKLNDVLDQTADAQTALIVFSAVPYVVAPLTDDVQTIRSMLPSINTDIVPAQGSNTALALQKAIELLQGSGSTEGSIWLFTDSNIDQNAITVARQINTAGYRLSVMGLGSDQGAPIPKADGGFIKDKEGNIVVVRLNAGPLAELANAGGGIFTRVGNTDTDIRRLLDADSRLSEPAIQDTETQRQSELWQERGPWILLLLTPLVALLFRRGWL